MTTSAADRRVSGWGKAGVPAENYRRNLVPVLFQAWADALMDLVDPRPGERVLDLACGTGVVARAAAARVGPEGAVTAVDLNAQMLAAGRDGSPPAPAIIEWKQADAADTGLPDGTFDIAVCQQGLQFFPDRPAAVRELHRVLRPGGRVAISVWCDPDSPGYPPFVAAFERHLPQLPAAVGFVRAIFGLADAGELHDLMTTAGFRDVHVRRETRPVRCASATAWAQAFLGAAPIPGIAAVSPSVRDRIVKEVAEALQPHVGDGGLSFPVSANVATGRRAPLTRA